MQDNNRPSGQTEKHPPQRGNISPFTKSESIPTSLRILMLEDQPGSRELLSAGLKQDNIDSEIILVQSRDAYVAAIGQKKFDAVISDVRLPDIDGKEALTLAKEICPDTPLIIFTDSVNEETGVECMKEGAAGFVLKQQQGRLVPALLSAIATAQNEKVLGDADHRYRTIFENSIEGIYQSTPEGRLISVNRALARIFGYDSPEEMMRSVKDISKQIYVDPERRQEFKILLEKSGRITGFEYEALRKDGEKIWISANAIAIKNEKGRILFYEGFAEDITGRKRADNQMAGLSKFPAENPNPVMRFAPDGKIVYANKSSAPILETWGRNIGELGPEEWQVFIRETHESGLSRETEIACSGKVFSLILTPIRDAGYVNIYARDITGRKLAEEALFESESKYRQLVEVSHDVIYAVDSEERITFVNQAVRRVFGYEPEEMIGHYYGDFVTPAQLEKNKAIGRKPLENGGPIVDYESEFLRKDGTPIILSTNAVFLRDKHGMIVGSTGIARDITEHRRAEEDLKRSATQLRSLAAHLQSIREEERTFVAREIHDQLGQALTGLIIDLSFIEDLLVGKVTRSKLSEISDKVRNMSALTAETIQIVRTVSAHLRPVILDSLGLSAAIDWEAEEFQKRTGIQSNCSLPEDEVKIDRDRSTALFRILQEALTNIVRHSKASRVNITLTRNTGGIVLELLDNGIGIPEESRPPNVSFGILGMKERALTFGGTVEVSSAPGKGTSVTANIPLI